MNLYPSSAPKFWDGMFVLPPCFNRHDHNSSNQFPVFFVDFLINSPSGYNQSAVSIKLEEVNVKEAGLVCVMKG